MKNAGRKVLGSALIGAVVGAVAGVLFAPKSGKETRKDIANKARTLESKAEQKAKSAASVAKKEGSTLLNKAKAVGRKAKRTISS